MKYNKLVRDNIPKYIRSKSVDPVFHTATDEEYWDKLKEKLQEEVSEFLESESMEELADTREVMDAIIMYKRFDPEEIARVQQEKAANRGKFEKRIILDEA